MWPKLMVLLLAGLSVDAIAATSCARLASAPMQTWIHALAAPLPPMTRDSLQEAGSDGRQLLALRAYLRAEDTLVERWSWSQDRIDSFASSSDRQALDDAITRVRERFEAANPGYSLFVNPNVRSLETQLQAWNGNPAVSRGAQAIECAFASWVSQSRSPRRPASVRAIREQLLAYKPDPPLPLAAPGLSAHGQMRAVDFHVVRGDEPVAVPDVGSIDAQWRQGGWAIKLKDAVEQSDAPFRGPLTLPNEPWHYEFVPR